MAFLMQVYLCMLIWEQKTKNDVFILPLNYHGVQTRQFSSLEDLIDQIKAGQWILWEKIFPFDTNTLEKLEGKYELSEEKSTF